MKKGKVYLIGAGPSDIGLLTIKGKKAIEEADVIFYDRLVSHSIISLAKNDAIMIDVGKKANKHTMPQEKINQLLLEYALEGNNVVRLKGGDPFLFGRGGEELELLRENNINFEVVNGITSAIAVPAYSGIPVTHRDYTSSLHIITGHKKNEDKYDIDFEALVRLNGTLVFLMGVSSLEIIRKGLLDANMDKNMPICILEKGTTAKQRIIKSTVENICIEAEAKKVQTPAIIIVGKVCELSEKFSFRQFLPLSKNRILVTRPKNINSKLCEKLRENGAEVIEIPTIKTKPLDNIENIENITKIFANLSKFNYIVFTSPTGVEEFFNKLKEYKKDIRELLNIKIATVGKATQKAIEEKGVFVDIMPDIYTSEYLAKELKNVVKEKESILIIRPKEGSNEIIKTFEKDQICIEDLPLYETIYEKFKFINFDFDYEDIITFTSASTVKGFINAMEDYKIDFSKIKAVCIGKETEKEAKKYNINTVVSKKATIDSLVDKIIEISKGGE